jgi:hypothetical protein
MVLSDTQKKQAKLDLTQQYQIAIAAIKQAHTEQSQVLEDKRDTTIDNAHALDSETTLNAQATKKESLNLLNEQRKQIETTYAQTVQASKATESATIATARALYTTEKIALDKANNDSLLQKRLDYNQAVAQV